MISKREACKPGNDNYKRLARYIADVTHGGEKCLASWTAGCLAGDDYDLAIDEVRATQKCNQRSKREKTYHMIVSFRPEDNARLTPDVLKDIEKEFATALGYENHQRHCGVHVNTRNMHMHVAYNMIHPETKARHEPFRDYHKRDEVCRAMERKYGLTVDPGREEAIEKPTPKRENSRAKKYEAHSGLKSFDSYVRERKALLLKALNESGTWQDLHERLAQYGVALHLRGNGCVIVAIGSDVKGNHRVKASTVDREFSKARLEKKLGPYEKSLGNHAIKERYELEPAKKLHTSQDRELWRIYLLQRKEAQESGRRMVRSWKNFAFQARRFLEDERGR